MINLVETRTYPKELIDEFVETNKQFVRTNLEQSFKRRATSLSDEDTNVTCFLSESENVIAGQEYSFFEINKLQYDVQQSLFTLNTEISFPKECIEISLYADLIDTTSNSVISSFENKTTTSNKNLNYDVEQRIAVNTSVDGFAVIVYANWKASKHSKNSAAIFSYIFDDLSFECDCLYPKKEENYIKFPQNSITEFQKPPNIPALLDDARKDYIQIALFRMPDDKKDLDYLCEFGKDRSGQPYMCVPTSFDLILYSGNTKFCAPVKAICTISSLDPQSGGKYIVACGSTDNVTESALEINVKPNIIHIEMLKKWENSFPYGGSFHPYDFSYEVTVQLSTITDGQSHPNSHTIHAISSIKDEGRCLVKIPHISIRWGCLEENTLIKMADLSLRKIKDIRIGDIVACKGENNIVKNIWRGCEDKYVSITTDIQEDCSPLFTTTDHPVLTINGYKQAGKIAVGDVLISEHGEAQVTGVCLEEKEINVFNLSFDNSENAKAMLANGIYVGDFDCQNRYR